MSYTLQDATVREKTLDSRWENTDVSALTLRAIYNLYQGIYFELSHFAYPHTVFLNMQLVRDDLDSVEMEMTPQQWLTSIGNRTLPIVMSLPDPRESWVKYEDAFKAGYKVELINIGRHVDSNLPPGDKNDLLITKPTVNFNQFWRYFLVSINGFTHRATLGPSGIYVIDGGRTNRISNNNISGLFSFREVGMTEQIPITASMISQPVAGQALSGGFYLSLPKPIGDKVVLLSVGGFLHILDSTYSVVGDSLLKINFSKFNMVDRYYHSKDKINLESLPLVKSSQNPDQVLTESLFSDATVKAYMTLPQSFVILVDAKDVYLRKYRLDNSKLPGVYQTENNLKRLPMFGTYGRVLDYVSYVEDQKIVFNADYVNEPNLLYRTTEWRSGLSIDGSCYPARPWWNAEAYLVEFGKYQ